MIAIYICLFLLAGIPVNSEPPHHLETELVHYTLSKPDKTYILPPILKEISGITELDSVCVGCIQDENGILFIYDLVNEQIRRQCVFYGNGDYEGIARVNKTIYILRSDGTLFKITNYESSKVTPEIYQTGLPFRDIEGLCYDRKGERLLIAPKSDPVNGSQKKNNRFIYSYDMNAGKVSEKPLLVIDLSVIKKFVLENQVKVPVKKDKNGNKNTPDIEFRTSAIAIHPLTGRLYLLSGTEKLLFVFNMNGEIEDIEKLDKEIFSQPEGICFLKNGDMLISNEGKNKNPTILRFNFKK